jgi:hypothetical protein
MQYQGKVVRQPFSAGSKNEHAAVVLLTPHGALKIRRPGGNPFVDPELEKLVGQEISCDGEIYQGQLLMTGWKVIAAT